MEKKQRKSEKIKKKDDELRSDFQQTTLSPV